MNRRVSDQQMDASSRPAVIALTILTLRLMENWRTVVAAMGEEAPDTDSAMIVMAVVAVGAEKFTRAELEPELRTLAAPMPSGRLSRCNISSVAAATGISRETVRRKISYLIARGILEKDQADGIRVAASFAGRPEVRDIVQAQVEALVRAADQLRSSGVLASTEAD